MSKTLVCADDESQTMTIHCNFIPRDLVMYSELPERARADFDYVDECEHDSTRFFEYLGSWYDSHEYERLSNSGIIAARFPDLARFHGIQTDSYFSATVIQYVEQYERVIVARIHW